MYCIAHNITSPLGDTSADNLQAVLSGRSALRLYDHHFPSVESFCASLFSTPRGFVELAVSSAREALSRCAIDPAAPETVLVLSTTKGDRLDLLTPARRIAELLGNPNPPVIVSNACISGVSAQIVAARLLSQHRYEHAVLIGCDVLTQFIVSGFQSFKALSPDPCRPFDAERTGLNLGEAAATMVWSRRAPQTPSWQYVAGSMHNDANHISGPSRTGEGAYRCLRDVLSAVPAEQVDMVSVHGTATAYNDEMESIALFRAGLIDKPLAVFKGYYGHTLGTAGVLETILSMLLLERDTLLGCPRYTQCGTSHTPNLSAATRPLPSAALVSENGEHPSSKPSAAPTELNIPTKSETRTFIKMLSGFGGCNAAACFRRTSAPQNDSQQHPND